MLDRHRPRPDHRMDEDEPLTRARARAHAKVGLRSGRWKDRHGCVVLSKARALLLLPRVPGFPVRDRR
jgi:hypothetical protein